MVSRISGPNSFPSLNKSCRGFTQNGRAERSRVTLGVLCKHAGCLWQSGGRVRSFRTAHKESERIKYLCRRLWSRSRVPQVPLFLSLTTLGVPHSSRFSRRVGRDALKPRPAFRSTSLHQVLLRSRHRARDCSSALRLRSAQAFGREELFVRTL